DLPPYYQIKDFQETYGNFTDSTKLSPGMIEKIDGYTLHVLPHTKLFGYMRMVGLWNKLRLIRPDIVQCQSSIGWIPLDAALAKPFFSYKLFTENHMHASVFPLANRKVSFWNKERLRCITKRFIPGRFVSFFTQKCYGITTDCADIAVRFFGVQKSKIDVCLLGVCTEIFKPISGNEDLRMRTELRKHFGFSNNEIVCIYTGRFSEDKNPLALARAVTNLRKMGEPFCGLFVGNGTQSEAIHNCPGCVVHPFVPFQELGDFYRSSDIGVWPTQESTSMLDAAACGLPIVVNDTMVAIERIKGNGITYKLNDVNDLVRALHSLRNPQERILLGSYGAKKMMHKFSWESMAKRRLADYKAALNSRKNKQ
ncbi:MAG: glycosyltransferase family 4 protein, partial [Sedimentisphaerales bacterium]|nr:glycosyltransferase family 4 protein [Sedimentisphaerales bacterium]